MSFDEEWAQHQAAARTRLNGTDGPLPGLGGMSTTAADKKRAAKYMEENLLPDAVKAGKHAGASTQSVTGQAPAGTAEPSVWGGPGALNNWEIRVGLNTAMKTWGQQVNNVLARLNGEMGALRTASVMYTNNDIAIGDGMKPLIPPGAEGDGVTKDTPSMIATPKPPVMRAPLIDPYAKNTPAADGAE